MHQCEICNKEFRAAAWNTKVCSSGCAAIKQKNKKQIWHLHNKDSENKKSRLRVSKYSKEEKRVIYTKHRLKTNRKMLININCLVCGIQFMQRVSNSCYCNDVCQKTAIRLNSRHKARYANDINYKLRSILRNRLNKLIKRNKRQQSAIDLVGISLNELRLYLESLWQPGMSWGNHGQFGWHIDHIVPLSSFNLTDVEQLKKACHYTNLQPLWWQDNLKKSASV